MKKYHTIVIGLGGMGSAALYHLAQRGVDVCGIEQFEIAHDQGSSYGETRAIRKAYFEHPDYVPLLHRAYDLWADLQAKTTQNIITECGMIFAGPESSPAVHGLNTCYTEHDLPHDKLSASEAADRYSKFHFNKEDTVFYDPIAGYVVPEATIETHINLAGEAGATIKTGTEVKYWREIDGGVEVTTGKETMTADKLIICAGAWAGQVLAKLDLPLEIRRNVQLWYSTPDIDKYANDFPVWFMDRSYGGIYGFPSLDGKTMKAAVHTGQDLTKSPETLKRELVEDDQKLVLQCLEETFPGIQPQLDRYSVCMYTCTPDEHFIIDEHPDHENVYIAAGFSGHGFKFTPVIGEILAELAMTGHSRQPFDFLRLIRFT
jgi:sarcosine oxidase